MTMNISRRAAKSICLMLLPAADAARRLMAAAASYHIFDAAGHCYNRAAPPLINGLPRAGTASSKRRLVENDNMLLLFLKEATGPA